ncbi:hypothetical protein [Rhodopirellula sp. MGV]|uniref:hypothetical protein n=1 Tax=Rhodopirellula sp. MGV TaxID=2023130 RepID=UPI000B96FA23|nr:hypothetical protein [Rhodopirellula sp. MGV]OYP38904.1 hypothetical protein CGZ80_01405 [Rhodopirellula sp. MGV]PNY38282.1 phage replication protein [Rhodopirellula baltica]
MEYPKNRGAFFAHRLVRVLFKSCAIQDIGHHAATLIIHIAHTEDSARYQGAIRFWNSQLMDVLGFKSPKQLNAARNAAVESGWLHYERESGRKVGRYWTTIPPEVSQFDDSPIEPIHSESGTNSGMNNGTNSGKLSESGKVIHSESGTHCGMQSGKPSIPIPYPEHTGARTNENDDDAPDEGKPASVGRVAEYAKTLDAKKYQDATRCCDEFWDHYEANGWRQGKGTGRKIVNWQAAFRGWVRRQKGFGGHAPDDRDRVGYDTPVMMVPPTRKREATNV